MLHLTTMPIVFYYSSITILWFFNTCVNIFQPLGFAHDVTEYISMNTSVWTIHRWNTLFALFLLNKCRQELGRHMMQYWWIYPLGFLQWTCDSAGPSRARRYRELLRRCGLIKMVDDDFARTCMALFEANDLFELLTVIWAPIHDSSPFTTIRVPQVQLIKFATQSITSFAALASMRNAPLTTKQVKRSLFVVKPAKSYVIIAPRGRGKSTLLGDSLAKNAARNKKVALKRRQSSRDSNLKARFASTC